MLINRKVSVLSMVIMGLFCICVFLPGCSKSTNVKSLEKEGNSTKKEVSNTGKQLRGVDEKPVETLDRVQTLQKDKVHPLGEKAFILLPSNQDMNEAECTVHAAKLYRTPEDAGINRNQVLAEGSLHYDMETDMPTSFDVSKASFLLCDIGIKNINLNPTDTNITLLSLVCLTLDGKELKLVGLPAYFSESIDVPEGSKYYHFELPADQNMDAKVGWWVDPEQCKKENLYLMYNYRGMEKIQQYWDLEL